eukprot:4091591-Amphidinium_carterae.1
MSASLVESRKEQMQALLVSVVLSPNGVAELDFASCQKNTSRRRSGADHDDYYDVDVDDAVDHDDAYDVDTDDDANDADEEDDDDDDDD